MIVSKKHNFVFVKTRKTAGSTLEKLVYPYLGLEDIITGSERDDTPSRNIPLGMNGHATWNQIKEKFTNQKWWSNSYKFTIERNPWDKVVSSYFWHQKIKPHLFAQMTFEEYVKTCTLLPIDYTLYALRGNVQVDKVYKYEDMWEMYSDLNRLFDFDIKQEDLSNTKLKSDIRKVRDYREMHTPKTIELVANKFKPTIDLLGYTYD